MEEFLKNLLKEIKRNSWKKTSEATSREMLYATPKEICWITSGDTCERVPKGTRGETFEVIIMKFFKNIMEKHCKKKQTNH